MTTDLTLFLCKLAGLKTAKTTIVADPSEFKRKVDGLEALGAASQGRNILEAVIEKIAKPTIKVIRTEVSYEKQCEFREQYFYPTQSKLEHQLLHSVLASYDIATKYISPHPHVSDIAWREFVQAFELSLPSLAENYIELLSETPLFSFFTNEEIVLLEWPKAAHFNSDGRLHHESLPALQFCSESLYAWNGVVVPSHYIEAPELLEHADIVQEKNVERRRALLEILGPNKFAELLDIEVIEQSVDRKGNLQSLFRSKTKDDLINNHLYFAEVVCPSTNRHYFLSVPPHLKTAQAAVAWTFGMDEEGYDPQVET